MYSDPRTTQWSPDFAGSKTFITWTADIWALGCVFFEAAVWMATFERGRKEFCQARVNQTENSGRLADAGYRGTFHNGFKVLPTVRQKVNEISEYKTTVARLSQSVMKFVLDEMMDPQTKNPLPAAQLRERFCQILENHQPQIPEPEGPSKAATIPIQDRPSLRITSTIDNGRKDPSDESQRLVPLCQSSQEHRDVSGQTDTADEQDGQRPRPESPRLLAVSDVIQWIRRDELYDEEFYELKAELHSQKGRDQVFVIDNSASMWDHWPDVKRTVHALSYLVKGLGPRGFKIRMTNSQMKTRRKNLKNLFEDNDLFDKHKPDKTHGGKCQMETILSAVLPSVVNKAATRGLRCPLWKSGKIEGVDVYILTDGVWDNPPVGYDDEAGGVDAIETVIKILRRLDFARTFLSIQFIRFGQNHDGERRIGIMGMIPGVATGFRLLGCTTLDFGIHIPVYL
ncbi:hypothetical protein F4801DRAFT_605249 [Xylaria longipes]|nr:hypothetical protein F4801DRAFT_605249 [Xylaria longipes]